MLLEEASRTNGHHGKGGSTLHQLQGAAQSCTVTRPLWQIHHPQPITGPIKYKQPTKPHTWPNSGKKSTYQAPNNQSQYQKKKILNPHHIYGGMVLQSDPNLTWRS